jgi:hypothetical protein
MSAPVILVAKIVSTRQEDADFNHSKLVKRINDAIVAVSVDLRRATKTKNPHMKMTKARADGSRQVASVTSPPGIDAIDISQ